MKLVISKEVLAEHGLTFKEFGILLYYMDGGFGELHPEICNKLWSKNLLVKELTGFRFNLLLLQEVEGWFADSNSTPVEKDRYIILADKLRELYPAGRKPGTNYMWRDNTITIAKKLKILSDKFEVSFTDEEAIAATKRYIESFNGDYSYMQLLKYFILKRDLAKQEETSQLLSFMQNEDININNDIGELR